MKEHRSGEGSPLWTIGRLVAEGDEMVVLHGGEVVSGDGNAIAVPRHETRPEG
jgi:hypothetical protein